MACSCNNNAIGIWVCDGSGDCVVLTPPTSGGPWFPIRDTGNNTWTWYNLSSIIDDPGVGRPAKAPVTAKKLKKTAPKKN